MPVLIGYFNQDSFMVVMVRMAAVGVIVGWFTRFLLRTFFQECYRASMENAMEEVKVAQAMAVNPTMDAEELKKQLEKMQS